MFGPVDKRHMSTWWEERAAVVTEAIAMVAAQHQCGHAEAIALLRRRAEATDTDLETVAGAVIDSGSQLGYRDFGPGATTTGSDEAVATNPVSVT
jgi:hypothetical protein